MNLLYAFKVVRNSNLRSQVLFEKAFVYETLNVNAKIEPSVPFKLLIWYATVHWVVNNFLSALCKNKSSSRLQDKRENTTLDLSLMYSSIWKASPEFTKTWNTKNLWTRLRELEDPDVHEVLSDEAVELMPEELLFVEVCTFGKMTLWLSRK